MRFQKLLTRNNLQEKLFDQVVEQLAQRGQILKNDTIVDSTFIESPSSIRNQKKEQDPEAHSANKGNTWHFGYKAHIGVGSESSLVYTAKVTAAHIHDVAVASDLLTGKEEVIYGDSGYLDADKHPESLKRNKSVKAVRY